MNKERWVTIMKMAGITEAQMLAWHQAFEKLEPQAHQSFLEDLQLAQDEIEKIRAL